MTIIYDSPDGEGEGSSKEDSNPMPNVLLKTPEIFSQLHLVRNNDNAGSYSYHLDPLLPPAYSILDESTSKLRLDRMDRTLVLMGVAVEGLVGDGEETRQQLASCTVKVIAPKDGKEGTLLPFWAPFKITSYTEEARGEGEVDVQVYWTSTQLNASWLMTVPLPQPEFDPESEILEPTSVEDKKELQEVVEESDPRFYSVVFKSKSFHAHQRRPTVYHQRKFEWMQDSPGTTFKLTSSAENSPVAEFILEASDEKRARGIKGQLFFRDYCGKEWEGVVLASLGALVYIQDTMGLDNLTIKSKLAQVKETE